mgnify:FL=1
MRFARAPTPHCRATTPWSATRPWSATLLHAAAALAAAGISAGVATAADTSVLGIPGSWQLRETRAGNLCEARATFTADTPGALEGVVRVSSPCTDPGKGVWKVVFDGTTALSKPGLEQRMRPPTAAEAYQRAQGCPARPGRVPRACALAA